MRIAQPTSPPPPDPALPSQAPPTHSPSRLLPTDYPEHFWTSLSSRGQVDGKSRAFLMEGGSGRKTGGRGRLATGVPHAAAKNSNVRPFSRAPFWLVESQWGKNKCVSWGNELPYDCEVLSKLIFQGSLAFLPTAIKAINRTLRKKW